MEKRSLTVKMFGEFKLTCAGEPVVLERSNTTKATQLLQYLLYHCGEGIPKNKLLEILYEKDDVSNPTNNLKVTIFRLRKLLEVSPLPMDDYIIYRNGLYLWSGKIPLELDTKTFEISLDKAHSCTDKKEKAELLRQATTAYSGEFLPMLATEAWVTVESVRLKKRYLECVEELCGLYRESGEDEDCLTVCAEAAAIYPYEEELYLIRINTMLRAKRFKEATLAYNEAASLFFEELGISPSDEMEALYQKMCGEVDNDTLSLLDIKKYMREGDSKQGAYYCNYLTFIESYRIISRVIERNGQSVFLMLCTLTDTRGDALVGTKLHEVANHLHNAIKHSTRKGDIYTRYNKSQFLVMLIGINQENCSVVTDRIETWFRRESNVRGTRLQYNLLPAAEFRIDGPDMKFHSRFSEQL